MLYPFLNVVKFQLTVDWMGFLTEIVEKSFCRLFTKRFNTTLSKMKGLTHILIFEKIRDPGAILPYVELHGQNCNTWSGKSNCSLSSSRSFFLNLHFALTFYFPHRNRRYVEEINFNFWFVDKFSYAFLLPLPFPTIL